MTPQTRRGNGDMNRKSAIGGSGSCPRKRRDRYEPPPPEARQRRGLLAKIHIAKQQMGLADDQYEAMLTAFKVESAAAMTLPQLENLVKLMKHYGWKPVRRPVDRGTPSNGVPLSTTDRLDALRHRCVEIAQRIENGEKRLAGLGEKICGVSNIAWCRDAHKLERLLAVLGKIKEAI